MTPEKAEQVIKEMPEESFELEAFMTFLKEKREEMVSYAIAPDASGNIREWNAGAASIITQLIEGIKEIREDSH